MKPILLKQCPNPNVLEIPTCGKCGHRLHYKEWRNERGICCISSSIIDENYCPKCGEKVEGYEDHE